MKANPLDWRTQFNLNFAGELVVDLFAGGGGASTGIEMALGQPVDIAINHDPDAVSMHQANHPHTRHYISDVFEVDPLEATSGHPVGHLHASPDCTHFSQAKGGQTRRKAIRSLSWVVHKWAGKTRPRVITLENVEQILHWSPLVAKRCPRTGRVITIDTVVCPTSGRKINRVAEPGERVPVQEQFLVPDRRRRGHNWRHFIDGLRRMGYHVEWRTLRASDYGAPTTRERLYLIARCDGMAITWPEPTHHKLPKRGQQRWRPAADCIYFSIPGRSIFNRPKPLAEKTMRRIARGIDRFVLNATQPFIVPDKAGAKAGVLIQAGHGEGKPGCVQRWGLGAKPMDAPINTITASGSGGQAIVTAFMAQMNGGYNTTPGHDVRHPASTVTNSGSQQQLVTAHLATLRHHSVGAAATDPLSAITAGGEHHAIVQCTAAFISRQFSMSIGQVLDDPAPTITAGGGGKTALVECQLSPELAAGAQQVADFMARYGDDEVGHDPHPLIVTVNGCSHIIVDIHLRMLQPRELYRAQGFPDSYIIEHGHDGRRFSKSKQVRFVGNSVSPLPMCAIVRANHKQMQPAQREAS